MSGWYVDTPNPNDDKEWNIPDDAEYQNLFSTPEDFNLNSPVDWNDLSPDDIGEDWDDWEVEENGSFPVYDDKEWTVE